MLAADRLLGSWPSSALIGLATTVNISLNPSEGSSISHIPTAVGGLSTLKSGRVSVYQSRQGCLLTAVCPVTQEFTAIVQSSPQLGIVYLVYPKMQYKYIYIYKMHMKHQECFMQISPTFLFINVTQAGTGEQSKLENKGKI